MNRIEELTAKRAVIDEEIRNLQKDMQAPAIKQARDILKAVGLQLVKTTPLDRSAPRRGKAPASTHAPAPGRLSIACATGLERTTLPSRPTISTPSCMCSTTC